MDDSQKKSRNTLRLMLAGLYGGMAVIVGMDQSFSEWLTIMLIFAPVVLLFYALAKAWSRCPACREFFALDDGVKTGTWRAEFTCRYCGHTLERIAGNGGGGGGP